MLMAVGYRPLLHVQFTEQTKLLRQLAMITMHLSIAMKGLK